MTIAGQLKSLRQSFRDLSQFLNVIQTVGLTIPSNKCSKSTFTAALSTILMKALTEPLKKSIASLQVHSSVSTTTNYFNASSSTTDQFSTSMKSILLVSAVLLKHIMIPFNSLSNHEKMRKTKQKEMLSNKTKAIGTTTTTTKETTPLAPLDIISLQELSSIHAVSELLVWWGLGPRLPCGLRPEMSKRLISKSSMWSKSPKTLQFLISGTCFALGIDQPNKVNIFHGNLSNDVDFTWFLFDTMTTILSKPQLSTIVLPSFLPDILATALTISVSRVEREQQNQHNNTDKATVVTDSKDGVTISEKAQQFLKWVTREKSMKTDIDREDYFDCAPTVVVVGGMLRLMQHIGMYVSFIRETRQSHRGESDESEGSGGSDERKCAEGKRSLTTSKELVTSTTIKKIKQELDTLLSSILQRQGGLELMTGELLGHLQSPQSGADPSQSEIRVMELAVSIPKNKTIEEHYENMMKQSLIMASRALTQERIHHSMVRVAVMIISRISASKSLVSINAICGNSGDHSISLKPLFDASQTINNSTSCIQSWSSLEVQRSLSLLNVFLLAVPAEAHFLQILRLIALPGLLRLYTKLKHSRNGNSIHYKDVILLLLDSNGNNSNTKDAGKDLFVSIIKQIPLHHFRARYHCNWVELEGTDTLGGISLQLNNENNESSKDTKIKTILESLENSAMSEEFNAISSTMEWLVPLSNATIDLLNDGRSSQFLLGQLLCCFVEYYANFCLTTDFQYDDNNFQSNHQFDGGKDMKGYENERISSMLMVAHIIPLIVEAGSSGNMFQSRVEILQCMSNVLRRVSMATSVINNRTQNDKEDEVEKEYMLRAEYRVRNMLREPSIGFVDDTTATSRQNGQRRKEIEHESEEWEEIASLTLQITLMLLQSPDSNVSNEKGKHGAPSTVMETVLRTFLPSLEKLCAVQSVRSVVAKATTLRVLIVTQGWYKSSDTDRLKCVNEEKTTPALERDILIAMENTKHDHPAMRALGAVQLKQILERLPSISHDISGDNNNYEDYKILSETQKKVILTQIVSLLFELLPDVDSYVYLAAVNGLVSAGDVELQTTLDILIDAFVDPKRSLSQRTKLGEAIALASKRCGDVLPHYAENLIESFLFCSAIGSKYVSSTLQTTQMDEEDDSLTLQQYKLAVEAFRASCLSNLADICLTLGTNIKPYAHRICNVITPILQMEYSFGRSSASGVLTSQVMIEVLDVEHDKKNDEQKSLLHQKIGAGRSVKRSAIFVLRSVIKASGKEILHILTSHLSPITELLKLLATTDLDNVAKYHANQALIEFDDAIKSSITGGGEEFKKLNGGQKNVFRIRIPGLG
jgi:hypothetical protein